MSARQREALVALGVGAHTTKDVAASMGVAPNVAGKVLASLYRRSLVAVTRSDRWYATERGRRKVAA